MKQGIANMILVVAVLSALSGCSTTPVEHRVSANDQPILSAADVGSMIRVEVRALQSTPAEPVIVTRTD